MRYTRYNYKPPRKNSNFMIFIVLTLITAIILGTLISKVLPKNTSGKSTSNDKTKTNSENKVTPNKEDTDASKVNAETSSGDYVAIQCGAFSNKEKALVLKNSLMKFGTPFIVEENKLNKVLFGIYPTASIDSIIKWGNF